MSTPPPDGPEVAAGGLERLWGQCVALSRTRTQKNKRKKSKSLTRASFAASERDDRHSDHGDPDFCFFDENEALNQAYLRLSGLIMKKGSSAYLYIHLNGRKRRAHTQIRPSPFQTVQTKQY